tara:strand:- start:154 stop:543 length:390 start_codon:yes stop_codon:yes gene_type:complete
MLASCSQPEQVRVAAPPVPQISWPILPAGLTSGLRVPPAQTFVLGGGQRGSFTTAVTNRGSVPATLLLERDGQTSEVATLGPGERAAFRFSPGDAALVRNDDSGTIASLKVEVRGDTNLSMRYLDNLEN